MSLASKYRKSLDQRWCVRLKTTLPDGEEYDGVVTHNKRQFIVLREECDFGFDGVLLIPKRFIQGCRDNKYDTCCNAILRENGSITKAKAPRWLDACDSLIDVLDQFRRRDIWPAIEMFFHDGSETALYLGPITEMNEQTFCQKSYDAAGKWEKVYELEYDAICRIEFDSRYCNAFNAHMRGKDRA